MKKYFQLVGIFSIIFFHLFCLSLFADEVITIISDEITYDENKTTLTATGSVIVEYGDYKLSTPKLIYNKKNNILTAKHPIELQDKGTFKIMADSAEINDDFKKIIASHASALIEKTFYVKSEELQRFESGKTIFYTTEGTACQVCPSSPIPMWQIKSERIIHDHTAQQLQFKNARMEFLGLPIFYTPYLRIPEPGIKRATGLLTPKILTSDLLGVGVKQPFYINLNRTSDITLSLLKTTKTQFLLETDYRKIFSNGSLTISGAAKPRSRKNIIDGYFQIFGKLNVLNNSLLSYDATAVSDSGFLGKYGYSDTDRLTSKATLTKQMKRNFSEISTTYFTSLRDNEKEEYIIVPNFYSRYFKHNKRFDVFSGAEISVVGLKKKNLDSDYKIHASFDIEKTLKTKKGLRLKGSTKILSSLHRIHKKNTKKTLFKYIDPTFGLEVSYPLYRGSIKRVDTIKPMLQLVYNPLIKINDEIPNSDSQQIKLDQTSLFSLNRFSGLDKQESGLRLNAGVEYAVESNGPYSYDIAVGQIFRQNPSTQFSEGSGLSGMKSDVLISGNVDYKSLIAIHGEQLFDQNLKLKHVETTLSYLQPDRTVSSGLIFFEADLSENRPTDLLELTLGVEANIRKNWLSSFNLRRNLNENENINASLKFSYENECAKINLTFKKRFTETNSLPADTSVELTFDLNGIGENRNSKRKSNCLIYN